MFTDTSCEDVTNGLKEHSINHAASIKHGPDNSFKEEHNGIFYSSSNSELEKSPNTCNVDSNMLKDVNDCKEFQKCRKKYKSKGPQYGEPCPEFEPSLKS